MVRKDSPLLREVAATVKKVQTTLVEVSYTSIIFIMRKLS